MTSRLVAIEKNYTPSWRAWAAGMPTAISRNIDTLRPPPG
jgi:hypothetical protein